MFLKGEVQYGLLDAVPSHRVAARVDMSVSGNEGHRARGVREVSINDR